MDNFEIKAWIYLILKIIVIIGALNWGLVAIDERFNIVKLIANLFPSGSNELVERIIYIIVALSTIYIMLHRKTYLPFLDITIVPVSKFLSESKQKDFELEIVIDAKGGEKVIYWAANKSELSEKDNKNIKVSDHNKGYGNFENSGVSIVDKDGKAKLYVKCPQQYYVKYNKILPKHVHYRIVTKGKLGEVKTINLSC